MTLLSQKDSRERKKKIFNLNIIFQNLKQKKHRHIIIEKINLIHEKNNQRDKKDRENRENQNENFKNQKNLKKDGKDDRDKRNKSRNHLFERQ